LAVLQLCYSAWVNVFQRTSIDRKFMWMDKSILFFNFFGKFFLFVVTTIFQLHATHHIFCYFPLIEKSQNYNDKRNKKKNY